MATVKGRGVVWSVGAVVFTAGIVSGTNPNFTQSVGYGRNSDKFEVKDNQGVIRAQIFSGFKKNLSLSVIPCALSGTNTIANAVSSLDAHVIQPGTKVTLTDDLGALLDDSYNVISSKQNRTVDGVVTVDLELEASDESVDLTTTVS